METKAVRTKYVIQHVSGGHFLHIDGRKTSSFMEPCKFFYPEEIYEFLHERKHYQLDNPDEYRAVPVKITYELEVTEDVDTESTTQGS